MKEFVLNNGMVLPAVGYGTYLATKGNGKQSILDALANGYRFLDTASFYENEEEIGEAIRESGIDRKDLIITSKCWRHEMGYENVKKAFDASLNRLGTDYLDIYLIHWPVYKLKAPDWEEKIQETWLAMEELHAEGKLRSLGCSNFLPHHMYALMKTAKIMPVLDQLELHVGYMQEAAVAYCKEHNILPQAQSPLGRSKLVEDPEIVAMAAKYGVSTGQLLLRFLNQQGISVIPKSSNPERMRQNLDLFNFELTPYDLSYLRCLPQMAYTGEHPDMW